MGQSNRKGGFMAGRDSRKQSDHDDAVNAAAQIYEEHGKHAWINPDGEKNKKWAGRYIDVIATENEQATTGWVIEIETEDSVSEGEAKSQWKDYDSTYSKKWFLAVPLGSEQKAEALVKKHGIQNCEIITWQRGDDGTHTFWGLPGLGK